MKQGQPRKGLPLYSSIDGMTIQTETPRTGRPQASCTSRQPSYNPLLFSCCFAETRLHMYHPSQNRLSSDRYPLGRSFRKTAFKRGVLHFEGRVLLIPRPSVVTSLSDVPATAGLIPENTRDKAVSKSYLSP